MRISVRLLFFVAGMIVPHTGQAQIDLSSYLDNGGKTLELSHTATGLSLQDSDLAILKTAAFSNLEDLSLIGQRAIGDKGVSFLADLRLLSLDLSRTGVTDAGLLYLTKMPLQTLLLRGTRVTDQGLIKIHLLPLESLYLEGAATTETGAVKLRIAVFEATGNKPAVYTGRLAQ